MPTQMCLQLGRQHGGPTYLGATLPIQNLKSAVYNRNNCLPFPTKTKIKFTILYCRLIQSTSASLFSLSKMFEALMSLWMILLGQSWWRYCNPFATPTATLNLIFHSKHSEPEMLNVTSISHVRHQPLTLLLVHW